MWRSTCVRIRPPSCAGTASNWTGMGRPSSSYRKVLHTASRHSPTMQNCCTCIAPHGIMKRKPGCGTMIPSSPLAGRCPWHGSLPRTGISRWLKKAGCWNQAMKCRHCATPLHDVFLDLGSAPPSNAFLTADALSAPETWFPLKLFICSNCRLVQVDEVQSHAELFAPDYVYYSSFSRSWLAHAERYVERATARLKLDRDSLVVEIASNDGYLLQYVAARGIPCVGIEPTSGTARAARQKGIETLELFFGREF